VPPGAPADVVLPCSAAPGGVTSLGSSFSDAFMPLKVFALKTL
jgi:hypothetical protein